MDIQTCLKRSSESSFYGCLPMQDTLEFKKKLRVIKVRMMDGSVKSIAIDDSHIVEQLMVTICLKIGKLSCLFIFSIFKFLMSLVFDL